MNLDSATSNNALSSVPPSISISDDSKDLFLSDEGENVPPVGHEQADEVMTDRIPDRYSPIDLYAAATESLTANCLWNHNFHVVVN